eukprot:scaffold208825_cov32-Tisochrysis_lutea.AAC.5
MRRGKEPQQSPWREGQRTWPSSGPLSTTMPIGWWRDVERGVGCAKSRLVSVLFPPRKRGAELIPGTLSTMPDDCARSRPCESNCERTSTTCVFGRRIRIRNCGLECQVST